MFSRIFFFSINDPGIWRIKCVPGKEMMLVRSILLKALASRVRGEVCGPMGVRGKSPYPPMARCERIS